MQNRLTPFVLTLMTLFVSSGWVCAQETGMPPIDPNQVPQGEALPQIVTVMGHDVVPKKGLFEVASDMNVRDGPGTDYERVDGLSKGDRVRAVGRTEDNEWVAVSRDGTTLGFVYAPLLVPIVDGTLPEQFFGQITSDDLLGGIACEYRFRFERKLDVEGEDFQTADYEVRFRCASQQGGALFYVHMFLTEAPVNMSEGMHLIGIEARSVGDGMVEFLSTDFLYHPKTGELVFDGHSLPRFALPPQAQTYKTKTLKEALKTALEAAVGSWTEEAWTTLFANLDNEAE